MTCEYCEIADGKGKAEILYQDDDLVVAVKDLGVTPGQITVFPKKHATIMEMVSDEVLEKCSVMANKVSIAVFEGLGAQGTNIIVQNGLAAGQKIPHFAIEIIPRQENDGLNLQWEPKQLMEDEMESTFLALKEGVEKGVEPIKEEKKEEKKSSDKSDDKKEDSEKKKKEDKDNYMIKQLRRIP